MLAYTYVEKGRFELREKPLPVLSEETDAIVRVTLASICTSDLHIKHGSVPRAVPGITVGHEMVGVVEAVGAAVTRVKPGDRVTVNVETFCGSCFFCQHGYVNNCTDPHGGWALGCRIDGGQAEYVRVPLADQGLNRIPDGVSDRQALFVGDVLATGYWAARISEIKPEDTVAVIGAGPTGICTLLCVMLKQPKRILVCERDPQRLQFVREHYPQVLAAEPEEFAEYVRSHSDHGGADVVLEVAGTPDTFRLAWECARPNAVVTVVALYDGPQTLPLPDMYGKNLTFKTGGVDGCDCEAILELIAQGKIDTTPLITHTFCLRDIEVAYELFEKRADHVIKVALECSPGRQLILASASPRRLELLRQVGLTPVVEPSHVEEVVTSTEPDQVVMELSRQKAWDIAGAHRGEAAVIVGADTVVAVDGMILGKPKDREDAIGMITRLQGRKHQVYTGVTLVSCGASETALTFAERTDVEVYPMTRAQIEQYVDSGEPSDKAGAYGIQGKFAAFVSGISGDYSNVVGLPVGRVCRELARLEMQEGNA